MATIDLGNQLNRIVTTSRGFLFRQSELAQMTYGAFDIAYRKVQEDANETIDFVFPVGWNADHQPITSTKKYTKQEFQQQYQFLAVTQLATNSIVHLVTVIEAMMDDLLRAIFRKYPAKLSKDKQITVEAVLEADSLEAIHAHAIDTVLNQMGYQSPADYAESIRKLTGISLPECTAFHRYMELKATRDVYIHNRGIANKIYVAKAGQHARVKAGTFLPMDLRYYFESFEQCVQLTEWWEEQLHDKWHSSEYEKREETPSEAPGNEIAPATDEVGQELRALAAKLSPPPTSDGSVNVLIDEKKP